VFVFVRLVCEVETPEGGKEKEVIKPFWRPYLLISYAMD
jgi:hypothetical protein